MYPLIAVFFYYFINTIESVRLHPENEFTIPVDQPLFITYVVCSILYFYYLHLLYSLFRVEEEDADLEDVFTRFHELLEFHGLSTHTENTDPADEEHLM